MKKMIAAFACCVLFASSVMAQDNSTSVIVNSDVILTSVQEPAPDDQASASDVVAPPVQEGAVVEGHAMQAENDCGGCTSVVTNYAVPASNCCNPQPVCCPSRGISRPHVISRFRSRLTSFGGRNNCCCY
jgi:hypothetical protein